MPSSYISSAAGTSDTSCKLSERQAPLTRLSCECYCKQVAWSTLLHLHSMSFIKTNLTRSWWVYRNRGSLLEPPRFTAFNLVRRADLTIVCNLPVTAFSRNPRSTTTLSHGGRRSIVGFCCELGASIPMSCSPTDDTERGWCSTTVSQSIDRSYCAIPEMDSTVARTLARA